jgi:acyl-coenzyme A thioesterase PaaI-like protein
MDAKAFQDFYPDDVSHCYGCGRLNADGLHIESHWDNGDALCVFEPGPHYTAIPGYVYGGLIASLIDCHATGTASAAAYRAQGREMGSEPVLRFLTASLQVDYLRPTPLGLPLEVRAHVEDVKRRKVTVTATVSANGEVCARGRVVAVQMPDRMLVR